MEPGRNLRDYGGGFLLFCLVLGLLFGFIVLKPFLTIFLVAFVLATIAQPAYRWLLRRTGEKRRLSAAFTCFLIVVVVIVPLAVLLGIVAQQSLQAYAWVSEKVTAALQDESIITTITDLQKRWLPRLTINPQEVAQSLTGFAGNVSRFLVSLSAGVLAFLTNAIWQFLLMLFVLFYFLKDGGVFLRWIMHLTPLPASLQRELFERFRAVSESALFGIFVTALCQGFLGGIGFLIVGLQPLVWGFVMALFSMVPLVGTLLIWGPAALLLILTDRVAHGVFLILWGILVVAGSDNFIRPIIMRGKSELHPVLIVCSLLGGLFAFGYLGILLGPLAMVLAISLIQAYEAAARPVLDELHRR